MYDFVFRNLVSICYWICAVGIVCMAFYQFRRKKAVAFVRYAGESFCTLSGLKDAPVVFVKCWTLILRYGIKPEEFGFKDYVDFHAVAVHSFETYLRKLKSFEDDIRTQLRHENCPLHILKLNHLSSEYCKLRRDLRPELDILKSKKPHQKETQGAPHLFAHS